MKIFINLSFVLALFSFISCGKAVDVEGVVLSKHNVPVPNVEVRLQVFKGSDYPESEGALVKTDEQGKYRIHDRFKNQRAYKVFCLCDSGSALSGYLSKSANQNVDLLLQ